MLKSEQMSHMAYQGFLIATFGRLIKVLVYNFLLKNLNNRKVAKEYRW